MIELTPSLKRSLNSFIRYKGKLIVIFCCLGTSLLSAQDINWAMQIGGEASDGITAMAQNDDDELIIGGLYGATFSTTVADLPEYGGVDLFIAKINEAGELLWINSGGSADNDEVTDVVVDANQNIYVLGTYWLEATFDTITLQTTAGSKAIFLNKYSNDGKLLWSKNISSNGAKSAVAIKVDANNDLLLTGYFGNTLLMEEQTWLATADLDLFVCKLTQNGDLVWLTQAGLLGDIKPVDLVVASDGSVSISGTMLGQLAIAQDTFQNNTNDLDVFVTKFSADGEPLWGRKAGGVYRDNTTALAIDDSDNLYLTGDFRGVMKLNDNLSIETDGILDENFYLLKYDKNGIPIWGRSMGSLASEFTQDLVAYDGQLAVVGYFLGTMTIDGLTASAGADFDTFLAGFEAESGQMQWINVFAGTDLVLGNNLLKKADGFWAAGSFRESASFSNETLFSSGLYDGFILSIRESITPLTNIQLDIDVHLYPNPAQDFIFVATNLDDFTIEIYNALGQLQQSIENTKQLDIRFLPKGIYFFKIKNIEEDFVTKRVVIK